MQRLPSGWPVRSLLLLLGLAVFTGPLVGPAAAQPGPTLTRLRTEYRENPLGIDAKQPRFSWELVSDARGVVQSAYEIRLATSEAALDKRPLWATGRVSSNASIHRAYAGPPLESRRRYCWQVRVWDGTGQASPWSPVAWFEMGLLRPADWSAQWIAPQSAGDASKPQPSPMLRTSFKLAGPVAGARAYVSSLGLYEMEINGRPVGDQVFTPGWTSYDTRVQYQTYDVTDLLAAGENAAGISLADGWYRGPLGWGDNYNIYGRQLAAIAQIEVTYRNGKKETIATGPSWKASTGPILMSGVYDGETYDARLEKTGWSRAGFAEVGWGGVVVVDKSKDALVAPAGPPVRRTLEVKPVKILRTPGGDTVFDMGQNMVGRVRLRVQGPAGTTVKLRHAEVLDAKGNFYTENLRKAAQAVTYTLRGGGVETYEPHFTFQGFRYVAVSGLPADPSLDQITGVVIHSDMPATGRFETSDPLLNRLQENIVWGQRGNFLDVPTDCPQRDERLGWTGDAQVFSRTAAFNADVAGFFTKWLGDVRADQKAGGSVPHVIPDVLTRGKTDGGGATGWADAAVIVPWTMYQVYGDARFLEDSFDSMKKWVGYMRQRAGDKLLWQGDEHFGDWLAYATTRSDYPGATTDKDLLATAHFAYSAGLVARAATILGRDADAREMSALRDRVKAAFVKEYVTPNGRLASNTQTAYVLALAFDLLPPELRAQAADRLAADVKSFGNHLTTGFLGTPYLCRTLSDTGHLDAAYALLLQKTYPSWLYPVTRGATTIWERWDGIRPDGSMQDAGMNSFNHYAYGAIGAWMYSVVAGIDLDPAEPGYKHVLIQPRPGGGLTKASASFRSVHGEVASAWSIDGGTFVLNVTVPANTHATIRLPHAKPGEVKEGGQAVAQAAGVRSVRADGDSVVIETGSGRYAFTCPR
jgi:alpha-L-rhamnosidase